MKRKAPPGGSVSPVNGRYYRGGEYVPQVGRYFGHGRNRVARAEFERVAAGFLAERGLILEYRETVGDFALRSPDDPAGWKMSARYLRTLAAFLGK